MTTNTMTTKNAPTTDTTSNAEDKTVTYEYAYDVLVPTPEGGSDVQFYGFVRCEATAPICKVVSALIHHQLSLGRRVLRLKLLQAKSSDGGNPLVVLDGHHLPEDSFRSVTIGFGYNVRSEEETVIKYGKVEYPAYLSAKSVEYLLSSRLSTSEKQTPVSVFLRPELVFLSAQTLFVSLVNECEKLVDRRTSAVEPPKEESVTKVFEYKLLSDKTRMELNYGKVTYPSSMDSAVAVGILLEKLERIYGMGNASSVVLSIAVPVTALPETALSISLMPPVPFESSPSPSPMEMSEAEDSEESDSPTPPWNKEGKPDDIEILRFSSRSRDRRERVEGVIRKYWRQTKTEVLEFLNSLYPNKKLCYVSYEVKSNCGPVTLDTVELAESKAKLKMMAEILRLSREGQRLERRHKGGTSWSDCHLYQSDFDFNRYEYRLAPPRTPALMTFRCFQSELMMLLGDEKNFSPSRKIEVQELIRRYESKFISLPNN